MLMTDIKLFGDIDPKSLFPYVEDASLILVTCDPDDYSAAQICRAAEDSDAHIINLNVAADRTPDNKMAVYIRINRRNADSVVRSLERFGYTAQALSHDDADDDDYERARQRAAEILRILEI